MSTVQKRIITSIVSALLSVAPATFVLAQTAGDTASSTEATSTTTSATSTTTSGTTTSATSTDMNSPDFWRGFLFETIPDMNASLEVPPALPPVATAHAGAWFAGNGIDLNYWLSIFSNEPVTGAHFHCAPPGQNGPIVVNLLTHSSADVSSGANGEVSRGYIQESDIATTASGCSATIGYAISSLADLARAISQGNIYANVHTSSHPDGAARAQLMPFGIGSTTTSATTTTGAPSNATSTNTMATSTITMATSTATSTNSMATSSQTTASASTTAATSTPTATSTSQ